jgi:hypothetical protein
VSCYLFGGGGGGGGGVGADSSLPLGASAGSPFGAPDPPPHPAAARDSRQTPATRQAVRMVISPVGGSRGGQSELESTTIPSDMPEV